MSYLGGWQVVAVKYLRVYGSGRISKSLPATVRRLDSMALLEADSLPGNRWNIRFVLVTILEDSSSFREAW